MHENPSRETLSSFCEMEINALRKGLFLLEIIISGAPLIGLLGTVTGLVQVFSALPSKQGVDSLFSDGIGMATYNNRWIIHSYSSACSSCVFIKNYRKTGNFT